MASASCAWSRIMSAPRSIPQPARLGRAARDRRAVRGPAAVVAAPAFAIRKPAVAVFTLDDYVAAGIMSADQAERCARRRARQHPRRGRHLDRQDHADQRAAGRGREDADRVVIIEDTRELQCAAPNLVAMRTKDGVATLSDLVRSSLRLRPDRIPIGEVRGAKRSTS
jgi:type IV secretion system protein VirB11